MNFSLNLDWYVFISGHLDGKKIQLVCIYFRASRRQKNPIRTHTYIYMHIHWHTHWHGMIHTLYIHTSWYMHRYNIFGVCIGVYLHVSVRCMYSFICMYQPVWHVTACEFMCFLCIVLSMNLPPLHIQTHTYNTCTYKLACRVIHIHMICTKHMCMYVYNIYNTYMLFSIHTHMHMQVH